MEPRNDPFRPILWAGSSMEWRLILGSPLCCMPSGHKHVLATLSRYGDKWGDSIFPSQRTLAIRAGVSVKTVNHVLKRAEREGWIIRHEKDRPNGTGYLSHTYNLSSPEYLDDYLIGKSRAWHPPFTERILVKGENVRIERMK